MLPDARTNTGKSSEKRDAALALPLRPLSKVCHRYGVESAAGQLVMGKLWPRAVREETLRRVRALPTYDKETDTVVVCRYVNA